MLQVIINWLTIEQIMKISPEEIPDNSSDKITNKPLIEKFRLLQTRVAYGEGPFFQVFLAAETNTAKETVEKLCKTIAVPEKNVIEIDFPPDSMDINEILLRLSDTIGNMTGDTAIILVQGIEQRGKLVQNLHTGSDNAGMALDRVAHDYSQEIFDSHSGKRLNEVYKPLGKKIIIVTHIGHREGREIYEAMVKSALQTRFKTDIWEV